MPATSAGILMYRLRDGRIEVLLVHPGGPFWTHEDEGVWSIPKGLVEAGEECLAGAVREFGEETGFEARPPYLELGSIRQKSGKVVHAWACAGEVDLTQFKSNTFRLEWPRGSGRWIDVPEADRAAYFPLDEALKKINPGQVELLNRLEARMRQG